jgi:hypothetical protein
MSTDYWLACDHCIKQSLALNQKLTKPGPSDPPGNHAHIHRDDSVDNYERPVAHSSNGGSNVGIVVKFTVPDVMLRDDVWLIDSYDEVLTVGELIAKRGTGIVT